jgi:hypothetical protein
MRQKFTLMLKSGHKIRFKAKKVHIKYNSTELTGYEIDGMPRLKHNIMWMNIEDIVAIVKGWQ